MTNMKVFLTFIVTCLNFGNIHVDGLQCYSCFHINITLPHASNETNVFDESCKIGNAPQNRFKKNCENMDMDSDLRSLIGSGVTPLHQRSKADVSYTFTCATIHFDGKLNPELLSLPFSATLRTCIPSYRQITFEETCHNGTLLNAATSVNEVETMAVLLVTEDLIRLNAAETNSTVCTCHKKQYCNGEDENGGKETTTLTPVTISTNVPSVPSTTVIFVTSTTFTPVKTTNVTTELSTSTTGSTSKSTSTFPLALSMVVSVVVATRHLIIPVIA